MKKNILNYLLQFIIAILLICFIFVLLFKLTIFNKSYLINTLDKSNYYENLYNEAIDSMQTYVIQSGFKESILDNVISIDIIRNNTLDIIDHLYLDEPINIDTSFINDNISTNLDKSNIKKTSQINEFIKQMEDVYKVNTYFSNYDKYISLFNKINNYIDTALLIVSISLLIISLVYILIFRKIYNISILTNIILLIIIKYYVTNKLFISDLFVLSESFTNTILYIYNNLLLNVNYIMYSLIFIVILIYIYKIYINVILFKRR